MVPTANTSTPAGERCRTASTGRTRGCPPSRPSRAARPGRAGRGACRGRRRRARRRTSRTRVVGLSRDPSAQAMLVGYARGVFAMPAAPGLVAWWSPQPRGVLPLDGLHLSRSLRRSLRRYDVTVDAAFPRVLEACADPARPGAWISAALRREYAVLHAGGAAHSVETWDPAGRLVGGLFGVVLGGLFAGEVDVLGAARRVQDGAGAAGRRARRAAGRSRGPAPGRPMGDPAPALPRCGGAGPVAVRATSRARDDAPTSAGPRGREEVGASGRRPAPCPRGRRGGGAQPLTEPAVMPRTKKRCRLKKTMSGMIIVTNAPAVSR